jgi:hypothetical protein
MKTCQKTDPIERRTQHYFELAGKHGARKVIRFLVSVIEDLRADKRANKANGRAN